MDFTKIFKILNFPEFDLKTPEKKRNNAGYALRWSRESLKSL